MANQGVTMKVKSGNSYVTLYPQTLTTLIQNNNIGEVYKTEIELEVDDWNDAFQQTIAVADILQSDTPMVVRILEGTVAQMKKQENAYNLLNPITGVYAGDGFVRFTCKDKPQVNFKVQVHWTR